MLKYDVKYVMSRKGDIICVLYVYIQYSQSETTLFYVIYCIIYYILYNMMMKDITTLKMLIKYTFMLYISP